MTTVTNTAGPVQRKRRSKTGRRLVVTLVILLGLLVAADFAAAAVFEHEVSKRARQQFGLADDPSVKVGGFSFLAQAISGEYDLVTVEAKGIPVKDTLRDVAIKADLRGVQAPLSDIFSGSLQSVPVRHVEGQVKIKASDVNRAIQRNANEVVASFTNLTIDPASEKTVNTAPPEGAEEQPEDPEEIADEAGATAGVRMCGTADIAGLSTEICVYSIISLVDGKIVLAPKRLVLKNDVAAGALPASMQNRVLRQFAVPLDPGGLPFKVTPTAVKVQPQELTVTGEADNLVLGKTTG